MYITAFHANSASGSLSNQQKRAFCTCIILHFVILLKRLQRHQFYWSGGPLHFAPYSYSQPECSMEIIIKQSLALMWFNKVPLKNNNAEDSEGVLHQPFLAVWSRLNVYCTTAQRILNYAAFAFSCLKHACAISQHVERKDLCITQ